MKQGRQLTLELRHAGVLGKEVPGRVERPPAGVKTPVREPTPLALLPEEELEPPPLPLEMPVPVPPKPDAMSSPRASPTGSPSPWQASATIRTGKRRVRFMAASEKEGPRGEVVQGTSIR